MQWIFAARIRSMGQGNVLHVFVCPGGGGGSAFPNAMRHTPPEE